MPEVDKTLVSDIAEESGIFPLNVFIAVSRGYYDTFDIEQLLYDDSGFESPYLMQGIDEAVKRIRIAVEQKEKILIYGDYDCDGVTATALMCKYLKSAGAEVDFFVPHRERDGYGINCDVIEKYADEGYTLIITVDNGVNAVEEAEYCKEREVDLIITDHHLPQNQLPDAIAVIDPHIEGNGCEFRDLSGVGVAFKLICAIEDIPPEEMIHSFGDLVALGTIGDIMPLVAENRIIVKEGLKLLNRSSNAGIKALLSVANSSRYLTAGNVAFTLCPRINAAGRMDNAKLAVELLLSNNFEVAMEYAEILESFNSSRQQIEQKIFDSACAIIDSNGYCNDRVIVVDGYGWHIGVIGIAASKLVEKYNKPCIVITESEGKFVGSGRSISGFSLFDAINSCSDLLVKFGGHSLAAGLTVTEENIDLFRKQINEYVSEKELCFPSVKIDCRVNKIDSVLSLEVAKEIKVFEPYGSGNPAPIFGIMGVTLQQISSIGNGKHLRLRFMKNGTYFNALMFNCTEKQFGYEVGNTVDLAVNLEVNVYNEKESLSVIIKAIRLDGIDWDNTEKQLNAVSKFDAGKLSDKNEALSILPDRNEVGTVYKFLSKHKELEKNGAERLLLRYLPAGKVIIAIRALKEIGLVEENIVEDIKVYMADTSGNKSSLDNSKTLNKLKEIAG